MIEAGMPVLSRDGRRIGYVARIIAGGSLLPPGLTVTVLSLLGLRRRLITLTSFDVRDVRDGNVILRITRWEANNRWDQAALAAWPCE
jgi:hypothetical protein